MEAFLAEHQLCSDYCQDANSVSEITRATYRSSHRRCSVRKGVLRNFAKFTGKHL